ncbi:MAG: chemotaxis protein [Pseudomonadota bacterium]
MIPDLPDTARQATAAIKDVGDQLEHVFAEVGGHLGTAHTIFAELNSGLDSLSSELSGSGIEGASIALQNIATRLRRLAESLPVETALLGAIGTSTAQASVLLRQLIQQIHLITVIARSSRIEAASLEGNRDDFLSFTREASDLATAVEASIVVCSKEQSQLGAAIAASLGEQADFEKRYRDKLLSVSAELISTFSEIKHLQAQGAEIARMGKTSTLKIGEAVGIAIISLQAGDSTRQRLEHACSSLRKITPAAGASAASTNSLICLLQGAQLKNTVSEFDADVGKISGTLVRLSADAVEMVAHGRSLYGGKNNDMASFMAVMKQRLAEASVLISACGKAKVSVDASISTLEGLLERFRAAIASLNDTVVDITLIGMNAGLKASHLGVKGRAFVVIANELKQTADRISGTAKLLEPALTEIGQASDRLKDLRSSEETLNAAELEHSIAAAVEEIEGGNGRLVLQMDHLARESVQFESLMVRARNAVSDLGARFATLSGTADRLEKMDLHGVTLSPGEMGDVEALFDELYAQYTMELERDVHRALCARFGMKCRPAALAVAADADDVLFF